MEVALFVCTKADTKGIASNVFLKRREAEDYLTADYKEQVSECGGAEEFLEAVNNHLFSYIDEMEINEIKMDLKSLVCAAHEEKEAPKTQDKPYLFSVKEVIDGYESTTTSMVRTTCPEATAKQLAMNLRDSSLEDWSDELQGFVFNGGDYVTCTRYQIITNAQAFLWSMANEIKYLNQGASHE